FGVNSSPLINATNVARFVDEIKKAANEAKSNCDELLKRLKEVMPVLVEPGRDSLRLKTAQAAKSLVDSIIGSSDDNKLLEILATIDNETKDPAMSASRK